MAQADEHVELTIDTLSQGGDGLGRRDGKVVFVPFALPGERVRVEVIEPGRQFDRGRLVEVLEPSPERIEPRCPVFGDCGGCRFQNVAYATELAYKARLLREVCARIPGFDAGGLEPVRPSPREWRYRCRVQIHVARGRAGYRAVRSHRLVPTAVCPIADARLEPLIAACAQPEVNDLLLGGRRQRRVELRAGDPPSPVLVLLEAGTGDAEARARLAQAFNTATGTDVRVPGPDEEAELAWRTGEHVLQVRGGRFVQANPAQNRELVAAVVRVCEEHGSGRPVVDLFCGAGNIACALAPSCPRVIGVDLQPAIADARRNAERLGLTHCDFHVDNLLLPRKWQVRAWMPEQAMVVLDPPRGGAKLLAPILAEQRPVAIAYVSCDPPAFARDARLLREGGYALRRVLPLDMFPKTGDVELIGVFTPSSH